MEVHTQTADPSALGSVRWAIEAAFRVDKRFIHLFGPDTSAVLVLASNRIERYKMTIGIPTDETALRKAAFNLIDEIQSGLPDEYCRYLKHAGNGKVIAALRGSDGTIFALAGWPQAEAFVFLLAAANQNGGVPEKTWELFSNMDLIVHASADIGALLPKRQKAA